ncbi:nucleolar protein NOP52 variant [Trichoderma reesei RUT C-30]|uniref:Nucleolar protein NOP52 variant n=1 Tax=Hypocrea jecorina (strain ATCC 56765 / BCRC 32924 / NRRL 11460 / Rut C-30) TaxID=1344414 RepID=A0A024SL00_HYPJR|nr:nucleolar protein NOP52 variant [Trichoderma reesei RUT C-30]
MAADAVSAQQAQQMPFIKNLASSDRKLRVESLSSLQSFLSSRTSLTPLDARKLWTGLYYALWMTDRPRPQQALASDLANLVHDLQDACVETWLAAFWSVLGTQWPHIEALRLDKFLLLVRRVFAAQVRVVKQRGYKGGDDVVEGVKRVLAGWCFDKEDEQRVALGLRLHVLDVWVDELEREGALGDDDEDARAFVEFVGGLVEGLKRCPVKSVRQRAGESHDDERLPWVEKKEGEEDEDEDEEN